MGKKRKNTDPTCGSSQSEEMRACSACAGDYEDPDRTAWLQDADEDVAEATDFDAGATELGPERGQPEEEFPAKEQ